MPTTLIKYIYSNATEEVVRRGKKIHAMDRVAFIEHDPLLHSISFKVRDDVYATQYTVQIHRFNDLKAINLRCSCTYNVGRMCRHKAAALFYLQTLLAQNKLSQTQQIYDQAATNITLNPFNVKTIQLLCSNQTYTQAQQFLRLHKANIISTEKEHIKAIVTINEKEYEIRIERKEGNHFNTHCACNSESHHPLCIHKAIVLFQLFHTHGAAYFSSINDWKEQKNQLLQAYGYSLEDDLTGKFEFTYNNGKPFLRVLDTSLKRKPSNSSIDFALSNNATDVVEETSKPTEQTKLKLGVVINLNCIEYPYFRIDAVQGEVDEDNTQFINKVQRVDFGKVVNTNLLDEQDKILLQQLRKLQAIEIHKFLDRKSSFAGFWQNVKHASGKDFSSETSTLIIEYLHPKIKQLCVELQQSPFVFYLPEGKTFTTQHLQKINISAFFLHPTFKVQAQQEGFSIWGSVGIEDEKINLTQNEIDSTLLFKYKDCVYSWVNTKDVQTIQQVLPNKERFVPLNEWPQVLQEILLPLTQEYTIDFGALTQEHLTNVDPEMYIQLHESGDYIVFQPIFTYNGHSATNNMAKPILVVENNIIQTIERNLIAEKALAQHIQTLHPEFVTTEESYDVLLKGKEVLKQNWLFMFMQAMQEAKIPVQGWEKLKKFRFNTHKATTQISIGSQTDWFDVDVQVSFGNQQASIAQIKKALTAQQSYVQLTDGSLGILDAEWIKKYSLLFKIAESNQKQLKVTHHHVSIIEELFENKSEIETYTQLYAKIKQLKNAGQVSKIGAPAELQNILRSYQTEGFQWLCHLHYIGWGGILADDMGLGKTIQALSFLLHLKQTQQTIKVLIISPTTLLYNWENEIKKFTPQLSYHIHHGNQRTLTATTFDTVEIILTTYGTLRSDIELFTKIIFDYVVLDESQFIKNPTSKAAKAATLLQAKNKLCLSGTPLQNNTFDIYAQMHFLNPGMLGSIEHFKQHFAAPIDKMNDENTKEQLHKILQPFMLRRTKEQVASDLPPKTETVLYCEMGTEQRRIYETYRHVYRDKILGLINEQGIQKSQFTILQGLMKLRQICNSPAILKEAETSTAHSVKLDELTRELSENIGNHKALVFSQFLGMLSLIKEKLTEMHIPFVCFDGSTSAVGRETAVQQFQQNEDCRVFLISLKAGGVGLNLTAADYVYLIDPWWNPAVEQQAIDRTHRIGQNKNVFAYRMICKNSIEDKILKLQDKKRLLAKELISNDAGFTASLSKDDLEYLFGVN